MIGWSNIYHQIYKSQVSWMQGLTPSGVYERLFKLAQPRIPLSLPSLSLSLSLSPSLSLILPVRCSSGDRLSWLRRALSQVPSSPKHAFCRHPGLVQVGLPSSLTSSSTLVYHLHLLLGFPLLLFPSTPFFIILCFLVYRLMFEGMISQNMSRICFYFEYT